MSLAHSCPVLILVVGLLQIPSPFFLPPLSYTVRMTTADSLTMRGSRPTEQPNHPCECLWILLLKDLGYNAVPQHKDSYFEFIEFVSFVLYMHTHIHTIPKEHIMS